jgi:hypothetical protein
MIQGQRRIRRTTGNGLMAIVFTGVASLGFASLTTAAELRCSVPMTDGYWPTATDCLHILRTAVGLAQCDPACLCQPAGGPTTRTADALLCLQKSLFLPVLLDCKCPGSTLQVRDFSESPVLEYEHMESFGICAGLDSVLCAKIKELNDGALEFRATLLVEGDRSSGVDCLDYIDVYSDHPVDCVTTRNIQPRLLTETEVEFVRKKLSRVQVETAEDERCDGWWHVDTCWSDWFVFFQGSFTDDPCSAPRLEGDQVIRTVRMLDVLAANSPAASSAESRVHLLDCPCYACPTPSIDECLTNQDCIHRGDPLQPFCDGYVCSPCLFDEHCEEGSWCNHHQRRCVPYEFEPGNELAP